MPSQLGKHAKGNLHSEEITDAPPYATPKDAVTLLHSAVKHLEMAMRHLAEATLLQPSLDESLGIEAQRLIGVLAAVQAEIRALENQRLRETE
ncbi:MAG TPA: hypothetical protein VFU63_01730 [Ktedonobacterales bacterium]|nr:hypothetical protein [Ktedonobacterales bacterium]